MGFFPNFHKNQYSDLDTCSSFKIKLSFFFLAKGLKKSEKQNFWKFMFWGGYGPKKGQKMPFFWKSPTLDHCGKKLKWIDPFFIFSYHWTMSLRVVCKFSARNSHFGGFHGQFMKKKILKNGHFLTIFHVISIFDHENFVFQLICTPIYF